MKTENELLLVVGAVGAIYILQKTNLLGGIAKEIGTTTVNAFVDTASGVAQGAVAAAGQASSDSYSFGKDLGERQAIQIDYALGVPADQSLFDFFKDKALFAINPAAGMMQAVDAYATSAVSGVGNALGSLLPQGNWW